MRLSFHRPVPGRRLAPLASLCAALILAVAPAVGHAAPPQTAPPAPQNVNVRIPSTEPELSQWIADQWGQIPIEIRGLDRAQMQELQIIVDGIVVAGRHHLKNFPESAHRTEAITALVQSLSLNRERFRAKMNRDLKSFVDDAAERRLMVIDELRVYVQDLLKLTEEGLAGNPTPTQRARLHITRGDSFQHWNDHAKAAAEYRMTVDADPTGPLAARATFALIGELLDLRAFDEMREQAVVLMSHWPEKCRLAELTWLLHLANRYRGDLEQGRRLWDSMRPMLRAGARGEAIPLTKGALPERVRHTWEDYYGRSFFYRGFYTFARGEYEAASTHFAAFLDHYDGLAEQGITPPQSLGVYRQFQAVPYMTSLTALIGKPAPALGIGEQFGGGHASVVLLCSAQNARGAQRTFIPFLTKLANEDPEDPVRLHWVSSPGRIDESDPTRSTVAKMAELDQVAAELGYQGMRGLDPEAEIHRSYFLNPGTANMYVLDRKGNVIWHLIYPTTNDEGLVRRVFERARAK